MRWAAPVLRASLASAIGAYVVLFGVSAASLAATPRLFSAEHARWFLSCVATLLGAALAAAALHACHQQPRPRAGVVPAVLAVASAAGLSLLRLPDPAVVPFHLALILFMTAAVYDSGPFAIVATISALIVCFGLLAEGERVLAVSAIVVSALVGAAKVTVDGLADELRTQAGMLDQARWAATEFVRANLKLQDSISRSEIQSRSTERTRIAREVHDTVGHSLTGLLVQLSTVQELMRVKPERAADLLSDIERGIREALEQTRREVQGLREPSVRLSWQARWRQLCLNFAECTGVRVQLNVPDDLGAVGEDHGEVVFRIIQESLTNSIRHGRATYVDIGIRLKRDKGQLLLRVSDNGRGAGTVVVGSGLSGIRERAAALGGEVVWQTLPDRGFDVGVVLPWQT